MREKNNLKKAFLGNLENIKSRMQRKGIEVIDDIIWTGSWTGLCSLSDDSVKITDLVQRVYVFCIVIGKGFS